jgi:hypothetical protein
VEKDTIADRCRLQACHLGQPAPGFHHPTDPPNRSTAGNFRQQTIENTGHRILPLFALNRF